MLSYLYKNLGTGLLVAASAAVFVFSYPEAAVADGDGCETMECRREVAAARIGTANYHDLDIALSVGFATDGPCIRRSGVGTMGFHFKNAARVDQIVDPAEPEILLYLPDDEGEMQLVAAEYVVPNTGANPVPTLFGQPFHFNAGRNRYELHAWIWRNNPAGMFEDFNPKLNCPGF